MSGTITPVTRLYAARALRDFGDGFVAVLLPVYLRPWASAPSRSAWSRPLALLGSALMTLGDRPARRARRSSPPARGGVRADGR